MLADIAPAASHPGLAMGLGNLGIMYRILQHRPALNQDSLKLGHIVEGRRVRMDSAKIKAIVDWDPPTKVTELRSLLGLANYYRWFV